MADGSIHPDVSALEDEDDDAWARLQFRQLQAMAAVGVKIVQALSDQVDLAHKDPEVLHRLALTHARIARSVRQTHALEARLRRDLKAGADARRAKRKAEDQARRAEALTEGQRDLRRAARQAIAGHRPVDLHDSLNFRLNERLKDRVDAEALADRPFSTILFEICQALGVKPDWTLWRREPWAIAERRDRPPGSRYARLHDDKVAEGLWEDEREEREDLDPAIPRDARPPP